MNNSSLYKNNQLAEKLAQRALSNIGCMAHIADDNQISDFDIADGAWGIRVQIKESVGGQLEILSRGVLDKIHGAREGASHVERAR